MNELAELLIKNNISIGTVESFTVGNFATMLGNIPGISKVYKGSLVTYQSETKERLLGIEHPLIEKYGVVSKEIATLMCVNGKSILDVDLCVSFTGNAGPDAMEGKPVGEVVTKAIENGLLVISAGTNVLRMVPPLVITEADVDEMIEKLKKALV